MSPAARKPGRTSLRAQAETDTADLVQRALDRLGSGEDLRSILVDVAAEAYQRCHDTRAPWDDEVTPIVEPDQGDVRSSESTQRMRRYRS